MHRVMIILTMVVVIAFIVPVFAQVNWSTSLHFTRAGKDYWYKSENGGFEKLSQVSIDQMYCTACHGPTDAAGNAYTEQNPYPGASCADCHPNSNPAAEKSVDQCLGCHGRQKTERTGLGYTDVHQDSACWFCHKNTDMHGTAEEKFSMLEPGAISVDCDSCHRETTPPSPWVQAPLPDHSSVDPHQGKLHCTTCHTQSVITCYNCHFESQIVNKKRAKGKLKDFIVLVNRDKDNKIYPATFQSITYQDTTFVAYAPYYAHTITDQGRTCNDCHKNQYVQDWDNGNGEIKFATFEEGTQTLTAKPGVIPLPPDYQTTFKMDYIDYTGDPNDELPGTANWELIGKDVADLTQLLSLTPLTSDQMAALAAVVAIEDGDMTARPNGFALRQNYPNPFNPSTTIEFMLPKSARVTVKVFDVTGAEVKTIVSDENYSAGSHKVTFNAAGLASGIYFYRFSVGSLSTESGHSVAGEIADFIQTKKMFLLR